MHAVVKVDIFGPSTKTVEEGDFFQICVSKNIMTVRKIPFTLQLQPGTANGKNV